MTQSESLLSSLSLDVLEILGIGIVLLDAEQKIMLWNRWMVNASGVEAENLLGLPLVDGLPELAGSRLHGAAGSVLKSGLPVVLSPSLNRMPFNLLCPAARDVARLPMHQSIQLTPVRDAARNLYCLIQVQDVTAVAMREQILRERAEQLRRFAYLDGLTGVNNRRFFEEELAREWKASRRTQKPLSVLLIDVDHFKRFNDSLGHQAGDECLALVAQAMKGVLQRTEDILARYGGEEFVMLLPCTDRDGAVLVAQRVLEAVRQLAQPHPDSVVDVVTVSVGIASQENEEGMLAEELVGAADVALYLAKQQGRNRATY